MAEVQGSILNILLLIVLFFCGKAHNINSGNIFNSVFVVKTSNDGSILRTIDCSLVYENGQKNKFSVRSSK